MARQLGLRLPIHVRPLPVHYATPYKTTSFIPLATLETNCHKPSPTSPCALTLKYPTLLHHSVSQVLSIPYRKTLTSAILIRRGHCPAVKSSNSTASSRANDPCSANDAGGEEPSSFDTWLRLNHLPRHPAQPARSSIPSGKRRAGPLAPSASDSAAASDRSTVRHVTGHGGNVSCANGNSTTPSTALASLQHRRQPSPPQPHVGPAGGAPGSRRDLHALHSPHGAGPDDTTGPSRVVQSRDFHISELAAILGPLLSYPRVDWDPRHMVWVAYQPTTDTSPTTSPTTASPVPTSVQHSFPTRYSSRQQPYHDHSRTWVPVLRVVMPRLAPRPDGLYGDSTRRDRVVRGGGSGEGWETDSWTAATSKVTLESYLKELERAGLPAASSRHADVAQRVGVPVRDPGCMDTAACVEGSRACELGMGRSSVNLKDTIELGQVELEDGEEEADEEERRLLAEAEALYAAQQAGGVPAARAAAEAVGGGSATASINAGPSVGPPTAVRVPPVDSAAVLLSADSAALGVWLGGRLVRQKVLTGYTVRHCAGGSQARRDRRRGGGHTSVGAALRRSEAVRLWQAVALRLVEWGPLLAACRVLLRSGDVRMWGQLYEARRPAPPVDLHDARWETTGVGIPRPRLRDLVLLHRRLCTGRVERLHT